MMNSFSGHGVTGSWEYQTHAQAFARPEMFWTVFSATLLALVVFGALVYAFNMWTARNTHS
jgi:hypothetical protein